MKLIGSLTSPFVRKVRMVLAEKKLDCELVLEDAWNNQASMRQSNPLGKVPCLIMDGGEAIFDSRVIVEYLDTLSPVGRLIPANGRDRVEVRTWEALADGLLDASILARLETTWAGRPPAQRCSAWVDYQMDKVHSALEAMSCALGDKLYCVGGHFSLADIALICALGYIDFRFPDIAWASQYPNLKAFDEEWKARESVLQTVPA